MHLPCVETFAASWMNCRKGFLTTDETPNSNLKNLILQDSTFEADELVCVLGRMNDLKSFAYSDGQDSLVYEEGSFSPKRITAALLWFASHSLEHSTVHGEDYDVSIRSKQEILHVSLICGKISMMVDNRYNHFDGNDRPVDAKAGGGMNTLRCRKAYSISTHASPGHFDFEMTDDLPSIFLACPLDLTTPEVRSVLKNETRKKMNLIQNRLRHHFARFFRQTGTILQTANRE